MPRLNANVSRDPDPRPEAMPATDGPSLAEFHRLQQQVADLATGLQKAERFSQQTEDVLAVLQAMADREAADQRVREALSALQSNEQTTDDDELLDRQTMARLLSISPSKFDDLRRQHRLTPHITMQGRFPRWRREQLRELKRLVA